MNLGCQSLSQQYSANPLFHTPYPNTAPSSMPCPMLVSPLGDSSPSAAPWLLSGMGSGFVAGRCRQQPGTAPTPHREEPPQSCRAIWEGCCSIKGVRWEAVSWGRSSIGLKAKLTVKPGTVKSVAMTPVLPVEFSELYSITSGIPYMGLSFNMLCVPISHKAGGYQAASNPNFSTSRK